MQNFAEARERLNSSALICSLKLLGLSVLLFVVPLVSRAQIDTHPIVNATLSGKVIDAETKEPIPGAVLQLEGVTHAVQSDADGRFNFVTGQKLPFTIIVSYLGYIKQKVVATKTPITIALVPDKKQLTEVVVVGYGTQQKRNLIGSVSKINPEETKDIQAGSFDAQLQGKVAGVQISSNTGVPGETTNIRLRGATSINGDNNPLYVVDGVFFNSNSLQTYNTGGKATSPIADLNPADIESIEVLKDAEATALYGSRGANGVILITTKRGKYNQKTRINFNASTGAAKAAKLWDLATGPEQAELINENWVNTGKSYETRPFRPISEGGQGTPEEQQTYDRLSQVFRTAGMQNYNLSLSGGSDQTKYYISGGYNSQESILRPITFDRASFKLNLDQKISDKIQIGVSNTFGRTYRNEGRAGDGPQGGILQAALHSPTYLSPYNDEGELVGRAGFDNVELLMKYYDVNSESLRYIGNLYAEAELAKGLKLRSSFGIDFNDYDESEYWNTFLIAGSPNGLATSSVGKATTLLNEQTLNFNKVIGKHQISALVGNTIQVNKYARTYASGTGFANNSFKLISSAASTTSSQSWSKNNLLSFFGKVQYSFEGKYLVNASLRADGSSKFGADNQWGYFPAVGGAWILKEEKFLKDVSWLADLKVRLNYGVTGNQNGIGDFAARGLWSGGSSYQGNPGIAPQQLSNPNLRWERTSQTNLGIDAGFFKNRLNFSLNLYNKYTSDGLLEVTLPATTGFSGYYNNAAEISNKGFELLINSTNIETGNFSWSSSFNIARNKNNIEKLATPLKYGSRDLIQLQEGHPLYSFWVYKELYVDPQTGDVVYDDVNKDGDITADDRQLLGSVLPDFFGGFTNDFKYKGFDASVFFSFQYGNKIYNHNRFFGEAGGARGAARVIFASNLDRWQNPGDVTDTPRPDGININNYRDGGSRWLEDGSFLKLRSLNIGYTLPEKLTYRLKLHTLRVYAVATNLYTWTKYTGLDPESSSSSSQNAQGIDLGTPPQPRSFQLGINIGI